MVVVVVFGTVVLPIWHRKRAKRRYGRTLFAHAKSTYVSKIAKCVYLCIIAWIRMYMEQQSIYILQYTYIVLCIHTIEFMPFMLKLWCLCFTVYEFQHRFGSTKITAHIVGQLVIGDRVFFLLRTRVFCVCWIRQMLIGRVFGLLTRGELHIFLLEWRGCREVLIYGFSRIV